MTQKPRIVLASIWAPLALLLVPAIVAFAAMMEPSSISGDDAPGKAGAAILVLMPFAYPIVGLLMAAAGHFLFSIGKLTLRNMLIGCGVFSMATGAAFGLPSPFGVRDQIIGFGIFGGLTMLSLSLGAVCWWYLARLGQDNSQPR